MRFLLLTVLLVTTGCMSGMDSGRTLLNHRLPLESENIDQAAAQIDFNEVNHRQQIQATQRPAGSASEANTEQANKPQLKRTDRIIDLIEEAEDPELRRLLGTRLPDFDVDPGPAKKTKSQVQQAAYMHDSNEAESEMSEPDGDGVAAGPQPGVDSQLQQRHTVSADASQPTAPFATTIQLDTDSVALLKSIDSDARLRPSSAEADAANLPDLSIGLKQPAEAEEVSPGSWKSELRSTIHSLEKSLYQNDLNNDDQATMQIYLRLLHLIGNNQSRATRKIPELGETEQDFWANQMQALTTLLNDGHSDSQSATFQKASSVATDQALKHLRQAIRQLSHDADLQISSLTLCREVTGLGQFDEFESHEFLQAQQVLIYCELENFVTQQLTLNGQTAYQSDLKGSIKILNQENESVFQHEYSTVHDSGRRQRQDFFMYFPLTIPDLPPGNYRLFLEIEDLNGNKVAMAQRPVGFSVK